MITIIIIWLLSVTIDQFKNYITSTSWSTDDISIGYLLPTDHGHGKLSKKLIEELVKTHNNFLKHCDTFFKEAKKTE